MSVLLKCVKEGSKLRVKIISPGYSNYANCKFPKNIRVDGRKYTVEPSDIKLTATKGKFFYSVNAKAIKIVDEQKETELKLSELKIYEDKDQTDCVVCMLEIVENVDLKFVILAPCGHFCTCNVCAAKLDKCPICRADI